MERQPSPAGRRVSCLSWRLWCRGAVALLTAGVLGSPSFAAELSAEAGTATATTTSTEADADRLDDAGYLPGYREYPSLGLSSFGPRVGGLPGGITPAFMAPMPPGRWTLAFGGYFSMSGQWSSNDRLETQDGAHRLVFHAPPATIEEYGSFVSTNSVPGHWVQMYFRYGNRDVTAVAMLSTWNPSEPATYYQLGSQSFINNVYLDFRLPELRRGLRLSARTGYFYDVYGQLGQHNLGMYQNPIAAIVRGVGGTLTAEHDLTSRLTMSLAEGFMGNRNGKAPAGLTRQSPNYNTDPFLPAAYVEHAHLGFTFRGERTTVVARLHYVLNFAMDDRVEVENDNMVTRAIDESYVRDGRLQVFAGDVTITHARFGRLSVGAAHLRAHHAFGLRGAQSFGGEGEALTYRWLGAETYGTGTVNVVSFNYTGSIGQAATFPAPHASNRPDVIINAGGVLATSRSGNPLFDGRVRGKAGIDVLGVLASWFGAAVRFDAVVPNSKDARETFYVLAPRLLFKTNWQSRENLSIMYAKWFYGSHSHPEASSLVAPRLDDQLFALNVNLWW